MRKNHCYLWCVALIFTLTSGLFAQPPSSRAEWYEDREPENNFFWYDFHVAHHPYWIKAELDTLNFCRVRRNHIRSVKVFKWTNTTDSTEMTTITYDSTGLPWYLLPLVDTAQMNCINCDSVSWHANKPRRKIVDRDANRKKVWRTDKQGYITEYKYLNRGLIGRVVSPMIGHGDYKLMYAYDSCYQTVTETLYEKRYFSVFRRWKESGYRYVYTVDERGNLLSEFYYRMNESHEYVMESGHTYYYEYY